MERGRKLDIQLKAGRGRQAFSLSHLCLLESKMRTVLACALLALAGTPAANAEDQAAGKTEILDARMNNQALEAQKPGDLAFLRSDPWPMTSQ